jgi:hypothetical protein
LKAKNSEGSAFAADVNDGIWLSLGHWAVASPSGGFVRVGPVTLQLFMPVFIRLQSQVLAGQIASARQRAWQLSGDDSI